MTLISSIFGVLALKVLPATYSHPLMTVCGRKAVSGKGFASRVVARLCSVPARNSRLREPAGIENADDASEKLWLHQSELVFEPSEVAAHTRLHGGLEDRLRA